jgi:hypothetical protein
VLSTVEQFFVDLSGGQRLLTFIIVVAVVSTLVALLAGGWRRVSSTLRHPASEFTDYLPLSLRRMAPAC